MSNFSSAVLKVASRCNLNCSYCYMYNLGDNSYKNQPKFMSDKIVDAILENVKIHCVKHGIHEFTFIFHGGEPLLCGQEFFKKFVSKTNDRLLPEVFPEFVMQTNGVLLTPEWVDFLEEQSISVSVSIDGYEDVNDEHRVYHNGKGSFVDILRGINHLRKGDLSAKVGVLSVLNINSDPEKLLQFFHTNNLNFDLLLLDGNYDHLPDQKLHFVDTTYGKWLCKTFDLWFDEYQQVSVRLFLNIILLLLGKNTSTDSYGSGSNGVMIIETDGSMEPVDVLKICGDGFTKNSLNIMNNSLDEAFEIKLINQYFNANNKIPTKCQNCSLNEICSGGYLPHRYSNTTGFDNPSIYCYDLAMLITHIRTRLLEGTGEPQYTFENFLKENEIYENNFATS